MLVEAPAARAACVIQEDLSNLDQVLTDLLVDDPLAEARLATKVYYLGEFDDGGLLPDGFLDAARRVIGAPGD